MNSRQPDYKRHDLQKCYRCGATAEGTHPVDGVSVCREHLPLPAPEPPPDTLRVPKLEVPDIAFLGTGPTDLFIEALQRGVVIPPTPLMNLPVCRDALVVAIRENKISWYCYCDTLKKIKDLLEQAHQGVPR